MSKYLKVITIPKNWVSLLLGDLYQRQHSLDISLSGHALRPYWYRYFHSSLHVNSKRTVNVKNPYRVYQQDPLHALGHS